MKADGIIIINICMRTWHASPKAVNSEKIKTNGDKNLEMDETVGKEERKK